MARYQPKKTPLIIGCVMTLLLAGCGSSSRLGGSDDPQSGRTAAAGGIYKIGTPYQIAGDWYYPEVNITYVATGIASWYGPKFHGRKTANGELFNMDLMTAAHPTLPMPVRVRVTNLENNRTVILRVNDRGPFKKNREIDVSRRAAEVLGFKDKGTTRVKVEYLGRAPLYDAAGRRIFSVEYDEPEVFYAARPTTPLSQKRVEAAPVGEVITRRLDDGTPIETKSANAPSHFRYTVQAGVFSDRDNADRLSRRLTDFAPSEVEQVERNGQALYRVLVGGANLRDLTADVLAQLVEAGYSDAHVIERLQ